MNLGKLLSAGKTFFGGKDTLCYRRNKHVYLPKFNPDRNPFQPKSVASTPAAPLKMEKTAAPVVAPGQKIFTPAAAARPVHATSWKTRLNPFHAPAPVAPPNSGAMQPELSLAAVKPVANDLSDADIEIVPAKSQTVTAVMTEAAPVVPLLKPARQAWEFLGERLVKPV
jgi:hypothetical protein